MTITLTDPVARESETVVRLMSFTSNVETRYAESLFRIGFMDGAVFVPTSDRKLIFQDNEAGDGKSGIADFSFQQLIDNVPEVRDLKLAMENAVVEFGVFDGTVS